MNQLKNKTDAELLAVLDDGIQEWSPSKTEAFLELFERGTTDRVTLCDLAKKSQAYECEHGRSIYKICDICDVGPEETPV